MASAWRWVLVTTTLLALVGGAVRADAVCSTTISNRVFASCQDLPALGASYAWTFNNATNAVDFAFTGKVLGSSECSHCCWRHGEVWIGSRVGFTDLGWVGLFVVLGRGDAGDGRVGGVGDKPDGRADAGHAGAGGVPEQHGADGAGVQRDGGGAGGRGAGAGAGERQLQQLLGDGGGRRGDHLRHAHAGRGAEREDQPGLEPGPVRGARHQPARAARPQRRQPPQRRLHRSHHRHRLRRRPPAPEPQKRMPP
jgi:hypothetical protein